MTSNSVVAEQESLDELSEELTNIIASSPMPEGTIRIGDPVWSGNGTASVTVNTSSSGYTIEYQINGTSDGGWKTISSGGSIDGLKNGDTVNVRLTDGGQTSKVQSKQIKDTIKPVVTVTAQGSPTTNSITVTA